MHNIRMLFDALSHAGQKAKSCFVGTQGATVGGEWISGLNKEFWKERIHIYYNKDGLMKK